MSLRLQAEINHLGQGYAILDTGLRVPGCLPQTGLVAVRPGCMSRSGRPARGAGRPRAEPVTTSGASTGPSRRGCKLARRTRQRDIADHPQRRHHQLSAHRHPFSILYNRTNNDLDPTRAIASMARDAVVQRRAVRRFLHRLASHRAHLRRPRRAGTDGAGHRGSLGSEPSASAAFLPDKFFYAGAGARYAASSIQSAGRAMRSTTRSAGQRRRGRASNCASASAGRSGPWRSSMRGSSYPYFFPDFAVCATGWRIPVSVTAPTSGRCALDVGFPVNRREGDPRSASVSAWDRPFDALAPSHSQRSLSASSPSRRSLVRCRPCQQRALSPLVSDR